jgi:cell wall-active antibiotic response 4TMS protein YvqF
MSAETIAGYCRACGKALAEADVHKAQGAMYCKEHVPMEGAPSSPYNPPPNTSPYNSSAYSGPPPLVRSDISPGLAFGLGFIPGVGAIYNGQYAKGLVHVAVIGVLISILNADIPERYEPLLVLMLVAFWAYMPFEAFHTARNRQLGQSVDEVSSLVPMGGSHFPVAPALLIGLGAILLLDNLGIFELRRMLRYWPVLLIVAGLYMLYNHFSASKGPRP